MTTIDVPRPTDALQSALDAAHLAGGRPVRARGFSARFDGGRPAATVDLIGRRNAAGGEGGNAAMSDWLTLFSDSFDALMPAHLFCHLTRQLTAPWNQSGEFPWKRSDQPRRSEHAPLRAYEDHLFRLIAAACSGEFQPRTVIVEHRMAIRGAGRARRRAESVWLWHGGAMTQFHDDPQMEESAVSRRMPRFPLEVCAWLDGVETLEIRFVCRIRSTHDLAKITPRLAAAECADAGEDESTAQ